MPVIHGSCTQEQVCSPVFDDVAMALATLIAFLSKEQLGGIRNLADDVPLYKRLRHARVIRKEAPGIPSMEAVSSFCSTKNKRIITTASSCIHLCSRERGCHHGIGDVGGFQAWLE